MTKKLNIIIILLFFGNIYSQNSVSLNDALNDFIFKSDEYKNIEKASNIEYLRYEIFKSSFLPTLNLDVNFPSYDHSISKVTQFNGEDIFIDRKQAFTDFSFTIDQAIPFTGGLLSINSSISRLDLLSSKEHSYSSNWFNVIFVQPLNGYNQFKWSKQINKLYFEKSQLDHIRRIEELRVEIIKKYFDVLEIKYKFDLTEKNLLIQQEDLKNKELLYKEGRILETDFLQLKISINQLLFDKKNQLISLKRNLEELKNLLNIEGDIELLPPNEPNQPNVTKELLRERMELYTIDTDYDIRLLEADDEIAKNKSLNGIQTNLQLAYGFNSQGEELNELYDIPSRREFLNLGISIPIIDWKKQRSKLEIAKINKEIIESELKISKELLSYRVDENIRILNSLFEQIEITKENMKMAEKNSELSKFQYNVNRLTFNEYQYEIFKEKTSTIDYLKNLRAIWLYRYQMRSLILYDLFLSKDLLN